MRVNVDADRAAAMVAGAVKAEQLIILTNVPGLMRNFPDESTRDPAHRQSAGWSSRSTLRKAA